MKHIGKYKILSELGAGAMGQVYLGLDEALDRKVAIKTLILSSNQEENEDQKSRFEQEAKSVAKCNHPNVVNLLDFGHEDETFYMVLEYVNGPNLAQYLNKKPKISFKLIIHYFVQMLKALHSAHQNKMIHRDIKPENILLASTSTLKLTDFGVAKSDSDDHLTKIGMAVGTPKYMSPEQMFGNEAVGNYSDIYSLFVVLYELFEFVEPKDTLNLMTLPDLNSLAKHNKFNEDIKVPEAMTEFLMKGLSTSVAERFQNVKSVVSSLKPIISVISNRTTQNSSGTNTTQSYFSSGTLISQNQDEFELEEGEFESLRNYLVDVLGPMSDIVLKNALKNSFSYDQFIMNIADKIDDMNFRDQFMNTWRKL